MDRCRRAADCGQDWLALTVVQKRGGVILVWAFNVTGTADLLYAFYKGSRVDV